MAAHAELAAILRDTRRRQRDGAFLRMRFSANHLY